MRLQTARFASEAFGVSVRLGNWSRRAAECFSEQWGPMAQERLDAGGGWDWEDIFARHRSDWHAFPLTLWAEEERLCGVALLTCSSESVKIVAVEGSPAADCPLAGLRAAIVIQAADGYARLLGRSEIRMVPANDALAAFYADMFGFEIERPRKGEPYYRRRVR